MNVDHLQLMDRLRLRIIKQVNFKQQVVVKLLLPMPCGPLFQNCISCSIKLAFSWIKRENFNLVEETIVNPWYLRCSTHGIDKPFAVVIPAQGDLQRLPIRIQQVLETLVFIYSFTNSDSHTVDNSWRRDTEGDINNISSVYTTIEKRLSVFIISSMYMAKSTGEKTEPCWTPVLNF